MKLFHYDNGRSEYAVWAKNKLHVRQLMKLAVEWQSRISDQNTNHQLKMAVPQAVSQVWRRPLDDDQAPWVPAEAR